MGGSDPSRQIRREQQNEEARIREGMDLIGRVFGGGTYGTNPASTYDPTATYYRGTGEQFAFDPNDASFLRWLNETGRNRPTGNPLRRMEPPAPPESFKDDYIKSLVGNGQLYTGTSTSPGFNDAFYGRRQQAFTDYANPFLSREFRDTGAQLKYKLANQGILGGSAGGQLGNSLARELTTQRQNVANEGMSQARDLRREVEAGRQQVTNQLIATGDPNMALQGALSTASQFSAPSPLPPVGQFFQNWINMNLARQVGANTGLGGRQAAQALNPFRSYSAPMGATSWNTN